jgi:heat shock protein HslJ
MRRSLVAALAAFAILASACSSTAGSGLTGKVWELIGVTTTVPASQSVIPPEEVGLYTIEFGAGGRYSAKADCNMTSGTFETTATGGLTLEPGPTTLALCPEPSLSDVYIAALLSAASYAVANDNLTITLADGGTLQYQ